MSDGKDAQRFWKDLMTGCNAEDCICENLRCLADELYAMPDSERKTRAFVLLLKSFVMAKSMSLRLAYYQKKYGDDTGSAGASLRTLPGDRERLLRRTVRRRLPFPEAG